MQDFYANEMPTFVPIEFNGLRLSSIHKFQLSVASTISLGISSALLIIRLGVVSVVVRPVGGTIFLGLPQAAN